MIKANKWSFIVLKLSANKTAKTKILTPNLRDVKNIYGISWNEQNSNAINTAIKLFP